MWRSNRCCTVLALQLFPLPTMKKITILFTLIVLLSGESFSQEVKELYKEEQGDDFPNLGEKPFDFGEEIEYKLYFGIFTVGRGKFKIQENSYKINGRPSYKVDVRAKTTGVIDWLAKVDDHWGGYIDTASLNPHRAYRIIKEGKYRLNEVVNYDHKSQMLEVKQMKRNDDSFREPMYYEFPQQLKDMISGFAYFRMVDFDTLELREVVTIPAFFEDTFYDMKIRYLGKETIETEVGYIRAHKVSPVMPDNKIFEGEDSILAWFSDDKNKIPLKVDAELYIGSGGLEITSFRKVKYPINFDMSKQ